jgi:hypothetical protein
VEPTVALEVAADDGSTHVAVYPDAIFDWSIVIENATAQ